MQRSVPIYEFGVSWELVSGKAILVLSARLPLNKGERLKCRCEQQRSKLIALSGTRMINEHETSWTQKGFDDRHISGGC